MADAGDDAAYAQAVRFLTSLRSQKNQDVVAQKAFLQAKGLSEEVITKAFQDVKRPDSVTEEAASQAVGGIGSESDSEAFEKAAQMFDQPLTSESDSASSLSPPPPEAPPKTYPRSPLALYHQPQPGQQPSFIDPAIPTNPLTRYDVLLSFFRSMCYLLVLGGGVTGMIVALYRTYLIPRIVGTLDARSYLLKHHAEQYKILTNKVKSLRANSFSPNSQLGSTAPLKGVLKKVQFADDVANEKQGLEEEGKKEAGEEPLLEKKVEIEDAKLDKVEEDGEAKNGESNEKNIVIKSVDILEPIRNSLSRLGESLKADMSAAAIDTDIVPVVTPADDKVSASRPSAATVEEESDADSWVSEEDSDELEFDPYSPSSSRNSKRKHNPASTSASKATTLAAAKSASSTTAISLNSSLSTLNAYINSQTYMASANIYGGGRSMGLGSMGGGSTSSGSEKEGSKAGDVAQIRADIRNLKGLLLSRRNFPTYRTSPQVTTGS